MIRQGSGPRCTLEVFSCSVNRRPAILWQACSEQIRCSGCVALAEDGLFVCRGNTEESTLHGPCERAIIAIRISSGATEAQAIHGCERQESPQRRSICGFEN